MIKLNMKVYEANMSSRQGYMPEPTKYDDLVAIFGEPKRLYEEGSKVKCEWIGKLGNDIFTIYDYKQWDTEYKDNTEWNIGGYKKEVADKLIDIVTKYQNGKTKPKSLDDIFNSDWQGILD